MGTGALPLPIRKKSKCLGVEAVSNCVNTNSLCQAEI
jgi:hypothetical protein